MRRNERQAAGPSRWRCSSPLSDRDRAIQAVVVAARACAPDLRELAEAMSDLTQGIHAALDDGQLGAAEVLDVLAGAGMSLADLPEDVAARLGA